MVKIILDNKKCYLFSNFNEIYANMGVDDNGLPKYRFTFGGGMLHVGFFKTREEATISEHDIDKLFAKMDKFHA